MMEEIMDKIFQFYAERRLILGPGCQQGRTEMMNIFSKRILKACKNGDNAFKGRGTFELPLRLVVALAERFFHC